MGQETTVALALVLMVLTVVASLPGAVIKTLSLSNLHVCVILDTLVSHALKKQRVRGRCVFEIIDSEKKMKSKPVKFTFTVIH